MDDIQKTRQELEDACSLIKASLPEFLHTPAGFTWEGRAYRPGIGVLETPRADPSDPTSMVWRDCPQNHSRKIIGQMAFSLGLPLLPYCSVEQTRQQTELGEIDPKNITREWRTAAADGLISIHASSSEINFFSVDGDALIFGFHSGRWVRNLSDSHASSELEEEKKRIQLAYPPNPTLIEELAFPEIVASHGSPSGKKAR